MKKATILFTLLAVVSFGYTQESGLKVIARIDGLPAGQWVYYREQGGDDKRDSVKTSAGGFSFHIPIEANEGNNYLFSIGHDFGDPNSVLFVYLDEGELDIVGNGPLFKGVSLAGSAWVEEYNDFQRTVEHEKVMALHEQQAEFYRRGDMAATDTLMRELERIVIARRPKAEQWIRDHPASPISAWAIHEDFRQADLEEVEVLLDGLTDAAKKNRLAKDVAIRIEAGKATAIGQQAPAFTQSDPDGKPVSLADFLGQYVLLDFWASWCVPCREENPYVVSVYERFKEKNFTVLGVSLDNPGKKQDWLAAIEKDGLPWTHVSDLQGWNNTVVEQYNVSGIPANFLIDPQGKIVAKNLRGENLERTIAEILEK